MASPWDNKRFDQGLAGFFAGCPIAIFGIVGGLLNGPGISGFWALMIVFGLIVAISLPLYYWVLPRVQVWIGSEGDEPWYRPVSKPEVGVVSESIWKRDVPVTRLYSISRDGFTLQISIFVDNTQNNLGGKIKRGEYQLSWRKSEDGKWAKLGLGNIGGFDLPAGERVYQTSEITLMAGSETAQMAVYLLRGGIAFVAIDGTAKFGIGPLSKTLNFFEVIEISLENKSNDNTVPGPDIISETMIE